METDAEILIHGYVSQRIGNEIHMAFALETRVADALQRIPAGCGSPRNGRKYQRCEDRSKNFHHGLTSIPGSPK